jgi:toxin ParE1/3/4
VTRRVVLSAKAKKNLDSIFRYIARKSSARIAASYTESIRQACEELSTFPFRGTNQSAISPGARTTGFDRSATIVFRVFDEEVVIVAIHYRGRNVHARL